MMLDHILKRDQGGERKQPAKLGQRGRHFEALYMRSFIEMRARSPRGEPGA